MIIRDSSSTFIDQPISTYSSSSNLTVGIIIEEIYDQESNTFSYGVESIKNGRKFYMKCRTLVNSGDIFNHEERGLRVLSAQARKEALDDMYASKPGEVVIVASIDGVDTDGVIVGYLKHPGRSTRRKPKEMAYYWNYNGIDISVDKDGAYKLNFNGLPTNIADIENSVDKILPEPKYNNKIAGTHIHVDKDGAFEIGDGALEKPQSIKIDKQNGKTTITSGEIIITLEKTSKKMSVVCSDLTITTDKTIKIKTKKAELEATDTMKIKSPKIAIGYSGTELLDLISQLITAIGNMSVITPSPGAPLPPMTTSLNWAMITMIKTKINSIKGSL